MDDPGTIPWSANGLSLLEGPLVTEGEAVSFSLVLAEMDFSLDGIEVDVSFSCRGRRALDFPVSRRSICFIFSKP